MGNQQQAPVEGKRKYKENKVFHENTHRLKDASIIYSAYSASGSSLKCVNVPEQDLNFYIHTKNPKSVQSNRNVRDQNYAFEEKQDIRQSHDIFREDMNLKPKFKLSLDKKIGIANINPIGTLDFDRKLRHFVQKPQKTSGSQIVDE